MKILSFFPVALFAAWPHAAAHAQHEHHVATDSVARHVQLGAMATGVFTRASPAYASRTYQELQLVQPNVFATMQWNRLTFNATLNGEGYTLRRGELNAGIFGEGYVDRRHPHTLVHEAMLALASSPAKHARTLSASIAIGKGFVPFGSDDPMMRPFEKYPVNHHYSQILERVQVAGAVHIGQGHRQLVAEVARFNGDEPAGPFHGPEWSRFGDSWATRLTLQVLPGLELAGSRAMVISPELQQGGAFDHAQRHLSVRWERPRERSHQYLLAEWGRTDEITNHRTAFRYQTILAEAATRWRIGTVALRWEQTDRAEQTRLLDPFRAPLGHVSFQILGVTRWSMSTVALEAPSLKSQYLGFAPFFEVTQARAVPHTRPVVFEPRDFYGSRTMWSLTAGVRMHAGTMHARMGHYGVSTITSGNNASSHP